MCVCGGGGGDTSGNEAVRGRGREYVPPREIVTHSSVPAMSVRD